MASLPDPVPRSSSNLPLLGAALVLGTIAVLIRFRAAIVDGVVNGITDALRPVPVVVADGLSYRWRSPQPVIADFDGDGEDDVLGVIETPDHARVWLLAWSGADWRALWQHEVELRPIPDDLRIVYTLGQAMLIAGRRLTIIDAETGVNNWRTEYDHAIVGVGVVDGYPHIQLANGEQLTLEIGFVSRRPRPWTPHEAIRRRDDHSQTPPAPELLVRLAELVPEAVSEGAGQPELLGTLVATPRRIYLVHAGRLHVLDADTGALVQILGERP